MRWLIVIYFTLVLIPGRFAEAADFSKSKNGLCSIEVKGEIVEGDSKKFAEIANSVGLLDGKAGDYVFNEIEEAICLNSPGGSWGEGRSIAQTVFEFGITTRVLAGNECLSTCSLVFMAGRFLGAEFDGPSRYLDVRGRLGFHGPYLVPSDERTYSASEMHDVSVMQNSIISDFIRFGSSGYAHSNSGSISMSLVGDMLSYGPEEILFADTVERIARWNISLEGARESIRLNTGRLFQACENVLNFPFDRPARTIVLETYQYEPELEVKYLVSSSGTATVFGQVQFSGDANRVCLIQLNDSGGMEINMDVKGIYICADNGNTGIVNGKCPEYPVYLPFYYALPPKTEIVSLSD